jgi:hemoglobin
MKCSRSMSADTPARIDDDGPTPARRARDSLSPPVFARLVDSESIRLLVHRFYGRVRENFSLGPIFRGVIGEDPAAWEEHLAKLCDFWETVLLGVAKYKGRPIIVHRRMRGLEAAHYEAWLNLFERTAREIFAPEDADRMLTMARRMARAMRRA